MRSKYADVAKQLAEDAVSFLCEDADEETRARNVYFLSLKFVPTLRRNYRRSRTAKRIKGGPDHG
jgi:hypothetical protein